jgi:DNA-binding transcriptional LysR family regulator
MPTMNLQHLKFLVEVERCGFHLSRAARNLSSSQPAVTLGIQALEQALGMQLLSRKDRRIVGLTAEGEEVMLRAKRILEETEQLMVMGRRRRAKTEQLRIITTHSQARYLLPDVIQKFAARHPDVHIAVMQGKNDQIMESLLSGDADVGLFNSSVTDHEQLVYIPYGHSQRVVIVAKDHPLADAHAIAMDDLGKYPVVIYEPATSNSSVVSALESLSQRSPQVIHCTNTDVVKSYVKRGIGISVVPDFVFDSHEDWDLRALSASHLFRGSDLYVVMRRQKSVDPKVMHFFQILSPLLDRHKIEVAMR